MGKREQRKWDLPWGQGAVLVLLCLLFLAGGMVGCLFAGLGDRSGAQELRDYLVDYLSLVLEGQAACPFWPAVWKELCRLLPVLLLGLAAAGVVVIPLVLAVRGFFFAFSVGCFCRVFGAAGLVPGLVLFGLPALLWGPALFLAAFQSMTSSQALMRRIMGDPRCALPFTPRYWLRAWLCILLVLACAGAEYAVVPVLLRAAARVVL